MKIQQPLLAEKLIRNIPDFPQQGILFRDITPVLSDAIAFDEVIKTMSRGAAEFSPDVIVGIESRGFLVGGPIALNLGLGFVPARKEGKLPYETIRAEYSLEYGVNSIEMHRDAIKPGQRVVIVDDLLATGGTANAAGELVTQLGGVVGGYVFFIELLPLEGRKKLEGQNVLSLVKF